MSLFLYVLLLVFGYCALFCNLLLINSTKITAVLLLVDMAGWMGASIFAASAAINRKIWLLSAILSIASIVFNGIYLLNGKYSFYLWGSLLSFLSLCTIAMVLWVGIGRGAVRHGVLAGCFTIALIPMAVLLWTAITPNTLITVMQSQMFHVGNSFSASEESHKSTDNENYILWNDVEYGTEYPNSYLDIYRSTVADEERHGTLIYIHGGGYTWGDKAGGDPNAADGALSSYFESFLKQGYDVVSINYAFAPEYQYPTPILQISQAVQYLTEHAQEYSISLDALVFAGGSAGGQLAGQFVNIQTNENYAAQMGVSSVLEPQQIKAVLFNSALLNCEDFSVTNDVLYDYLFFQLGRVYFGCGFLKGEPAVKESSVIGNITASFPPCYISDGNTATFYLQAQELDKQLTSLGITHEFNFYEKSTATLRHGYETSNSEWASDNLKQELLFLQKVIEGSV